jgi:hypothetical protein
MSLFSMYSRPNPSNMITTARCGGRWRNAGPERSAALEARNSRRESQEVLIEDPPQEVPTMFRRAELYMSYFVYALSMFRPSFPRRSVRIGVRPGVRFVAVGVAVIRSRLMIHVHPLEEILSFMLHQDVERIESLQSVLSRFSGKAPA